MPTVPTCYAIPTMSACVGSQAQSIKGTLVQRVVGEDGDWATGVYEALRMLLWRSSLSVASAGMYAAKHLGGHVMSRAFRSQVRSQQILLVSDERCQIVKPSFPLSLHVSAVELGHQVGQLIHEHHAHEKLCVLEHFLQCDRYISAMIENICSCVHDQLGDG